MLTVNSAEINISNVKYMFEAPKPITLEQVVKESAESKKYISIIKSNAYVNVINPVVHAGEVLQIVAETLGLDIDKVRSRKRDAPLTDARHIYCFIIMKLSSVTISQKSAGEIIGRDHTTVINSIKKAIELDETSKDFRDRLDKCIAEFKKRFSGEESYILNFNNIPQY